MKADHLLAATILVLLAGCETSPEIVDQQVSTQTVRLPIERVVDATDGDAVLRAYFVRWEGFEVPIVAPLFFYNRGDLVDVHVKDRPYPNKPSRHRLLGFGFVPLPSPPSTNAPKRQKTTPPPKGNFQAVDVQVLETYAANLGDARFRAYRVEWKGQDVIVVDPLADREYKRRDIIQVLISRRDFPIGKEPIGRYRILNVIMSHTPPGGQWDPYPGSDTSPMIPSVR